MDLRSLSTKAKQLIDKRGGTDSLKEDAAELKSIATGSGTLGDKAKAAAEAVKDPGGSPDAAAETGSAEPAATDAPEPAGDADAAERAERRARRQARREKRKRA